MRLSWPFRRVHEPLTAKLAPAAMPAVQRAPLQEWRDVEPSTGLSGPPRLTADPQFGRSLTGHRSLPPVLQHLARGGELAPMVESTGGRSAGSGREGIPGRSAAGTRSYRHPQRSRQAHAAGLPGLAGFASDETTVPAASLPPAPIPSRVEPTSRSAQGSSLSAHALTVLPEAQRSAIEQDTGSVGRVLLSGPSEPSAHVPPREPAVAEITATAGPSPSATQTPMVSLPGGSAATPTQRSATPGSKGHKRPSLGQSRRAGLGSPLDTRPSSGQSLDRATALGASLQRASVSEEIGAGLQRASVSEEIATGPTAVRPASEPQAQRLSANQQRSGTELTQVDDRPTRSVPTATTHGISSGGPVRIDRSQDGASAAAELGANAFTSGDTIVMPSAHGPLDSGRGQALLAHELVHVSQQRSMGSSLPAEHTAAGQDLEREAQSAESFVEQGHRGSPPAMALPLAHTGNQQASAETGSASHSDHVRRATSVATAVTGPGATAGDTDSYDFPTSHTPPQQTVPAPQRSALSSNSSGTPSAAGPDAHDDIDEVSRRVYERIRLRLRRELLLDRERSGYLTDPR